MNTVKAGRHDVDIMKIKFPQTVKVFGGASCEGNDMPTHIVEAEPGVQFRQLCKTAGVCEDTLVGEGLYGKPICVVTSFV